MLKRRTSVVLIRCNLFFYKTFNVLNIVNYYKCKPCYWMLLNLLIAKRVVVYIFFYLLIGLLLSATMEYMLVTEKDR